MTSDPELTLDVALTTLRAYAPDLPLTGYRAITHGWDSLVLLLDAALASDGSSATGTSSRSTVVRFARRPEVADQFRTEAALLPALAPTLPAPVPHFTHIHLPSQPDAPQEATIGSRTRRRKRASASGAAEVGSAGGRRSLAFVAYPLLPGEPLSSLPISPTASDSAAAADALRLAAQVGAFLDALHRFPLDRAAAISGLPLATPQTWRQEYADFYAWVRAEVFPLLAAHERAPVVALWESYLDDSDFFAFAPALIHRDLAAEHILYDPASATLTGVIDWGDVAIGDPALDFTGLLADLGTPFAEAALTAYTRPIDPTFRRRMAFYRGLLPFHQLRFGLLTSDSRHVADGLALLRSALPD